MTTRPSRRNSMRIFFDSMVDKIRRLRATKKQDLWEPWELDSVFFEALRQWSHDNPNSTLDRFLQRTIKAIDIGKEFLEMIPDGPVPIRGFLKALVHLVRLGATIGRAQREVYEFAKELVDWVDSIESAFRSKEIGPTTLQLQKGYLRGIRTLIDEICTWAVARMEDRRWSIQGLMVDKEIDDFKARIAAARALFANVAAISIAKNQDLQLKAVKSLVSTIKAIKLSQMNILEFLEDQKKEAERRKFLEDIFLHRTADKTEYDQQGKRPCDDDTRIEILRDIKEWIMDISSDTQRFLWLTGDPGSGKSAITASIARECKDSKVLWAQFFINRNLAGTTNPTSYFPSIARQLADHSPEVSLAIFNTLKAKPSLIDNISDDQAGKLFVNALRVASSTDLTKPVVVIIDGLDETDTDQLGTTAAIFAKALTNLPSNVKVFISSRTEDEIRKPFHSTFGKKPDKVKHVHLDTSSKSSIEDVSRFLKKGIVAVAQKNDLDVLVWPGKERLDILCKRAAGLFIWAVTVIGFIETEVKESGKEVLDTILDSLTPSDLTDINVLYGTILRMTFRGRKDPWKVERFHKIVGCLVVLREPLCIGDIALLLGLHNPDSGKPIDILNFFIRLRTVLVSGADVITLQTVPRLHKSFFEFITSEGANQHPSGADPTSPTSPTVPIVSTPLCVDTKIADGTIAMQCFTYISGSQVPSSRIAPMKSDSPSPVLPSKSLQGHSKIRRLLSNSPLLLRYACNHVQSHWGIGTGILIPSTAQLQDLDMRLTPIAVVPKGPLGANTDNTNCVTVSPDGRSLASGSGCTIRLRDTVTGVLIGPLLEGHTQEVWSIAFSPDERLLASASHDGTICLWDVDSGQQLGDPLTYHTGHVNAVVFSADGKRVVSGSDDKTVQVWNLESRRAICADGHTGIVRAVACSPKAMQHREYIISGSHDMTIRLWECSGEDVEFSSTFSGHSGKVVSVAFAPATAFGDSVQFISGALDQSIRLWDVTTKHCIRVFRGHTSSVWSISFSSDSKQMVSGCLDQTVRVWDLNTGDSIGHGTHTQKIRGVACRDRLIALSSDLGVQLWGQNEVSATATTLIPIFNYNDDILVSVSISPDCESIVAAFSNNNILIRRVATGKYIPLNAPPAWEAAGSGIVALTFSPDGNKLLVIYTGNIVCLWSMETEQLIKSYVPAFIPTKNPAFISFSSDGKHLIAFRTDGTHYAWDAENGNTVPFNTSNMHFQKEVLEEPMTLNNGARFTWYPLNNLDFGLCVATDETFIRRDNNGVVTIVPFTPSAPALPPPPTSPPFHTDEWTRGSPENQDFLDSRLNDLRQMLLKLVRPEDWLDGIVIAVVSSGAAESGVNFLTCLKFIEKLAGGKEDVERTLLPLPGLSLAKVKSRTRSDYDITFIHTTGADGHEEWDVETWKLLASWLTTTYERKITLTGVLYLLPSTIPNVSLDPFEDMNMIEEVCGRNAAEKIILMIPIEVPDREEENIRELWKTMLDQGSTITRWTGTPDSAWEVMCHFVDAGNDRHATQLEEEMFKAKEQLYETTAGRDLYSVLDILVTTQHERLHESRTKKGDHYTRDAKSEKALEMSVKAKYKKMQRQIAATVDEIQALRLPLRPELLSLLHLGPTVGLSALGQVNGDLDA